MTFKGTARQTLTMDFNGTEEELLEMTEHAYGPLDSRDRGDALGAIFEMTLAEDDHTLAWVSQRRDGSFAEMHAIVEPDLFEWEGI